MVPNWTFPKLALAGLAPSAPTPCPDPVSCRLTVATLLVNATLPVTFPVACGANPTVKLELCPGPRLNGMLSPLTVNPAPAAVAPVIVTELPPEFVMVAVWF